LKLFIENRIRAGEDASTIIRKMQYGYGREVLNDPILARMLKEGSEGIVGAVVEGFGDKILAEPDSTPVNFTLAVFALGGILLVLWYFKRMRKTSTDPKIAKEVSSDAAKYLKEIE
jgi:cytochrome c-type biogenesis protein CcmH/NrfF